MSDTFDDNWVPSGIPFEDLNPDAPDSRGFSAEHATFATGSIRVFDDTVTTRAKCGGGVDATAPAPVTPAE